MNAQTYRTWHVDYDAKPIPHRGFDWTATHPDYDGEGDDRIVHAATFEELTVEVDCAIADLQDDFSARDWIASAVRVGDAYATADRAIKLLADAGFCIISSEVAV